MAPRHLVGDVAWTLFGEAGYEPIAPGWPGDPDTVEAARANPEALADHGISEVTDHYAKIIEQLPAPPILVGHSFGGMIAEKLLGEGYGAGAIAIDAAQIKGVLPLPLSSLHSTLPVFKNPANKHKAVALTAEQFRYSFGNAIGEEESNELYQRWAIPAPGRRSSRPRPPTSSCTLRTRSTPATRTAGRCCSSWAAGSYGARGHHQVHAQAVPALQRRHRPGRVRPRSLPDHRLRLARRRRRVPGLARPERPVANRRNRGRSTMGTMMALRAHARGGPKQLVCEQAPAPSAGPSEALIGVHAAAITFAELTWDLGR